MVKFGLPVFLRFGLMVKNSALRFSYNSAFRIRPNGPVRNSRYFGNSSVVLATLQFVIVLGYATTSLATTCLRFVLASKFNFTDFIKDM